MPLRCYPAATLLLLGASACTKEAPAPPAAVTVAGSGMPTFERRPLNLAEEDLPEERYLMFDVASDGSVAYQASATQAPMIRRIDSTGHHLTAFGREGEGPGELRGFVGIEMRGDTLLLFNSMRFALIEMTLTGELLRERPLTHVGSTLAWFADSVDFRQAVVEGSIRVERVRRAKIGESTGRLLFDASNAAFAAASGKGPGERNPPLWLPYAATPDRIWLADPWNYRITSFDSDGRQLGEVTHAIAPNQRGPRAIAETRERIAKAPRFTRGANGERMEVADQRGRLDTLERERIRHFTRNPLHVDEFGRLWVVGVSRDSTTVDLFADMTFVGRVMLPCYASDVGLRVAFGRGGWMVLECEVEGGDWPTELQLYRIVERPTP